MGSRTEYGAGDRGHRNPGAACLMALGGPDLSGGLALLRTAIYAGNPTGSVVDGSMRLEWASILFAQVMVQDARKDISERFVPWPIGKAVVGTRFKNAPMGPAAGWQAFGCVSIRSARPIRGMRLAARRSGVRFCGEAKATFPGTGQGSGRRRSASASRACLSSNPLGAQDP